MKVFKIQATWQVQGYIVVKADSLEEAIEEAYDAPVTEYEDVKYVDDTFKILHKDCSVGKGKIVTEDMTSLPEQLIKDTLKNRYSYM